MGKSKSVYSALEKTRYKADPFIIHLLAVKGEKRFGEIKTFLHNKGIDYADNKGLDLKLKTLIKKKIIYKKIIPGKRPLYGIQKKTLAEIEIKAILFAKELGDKLFFDLIKPPNKKTKTTDYLEQMVRTAGIYFVFNLIFADKLSDSEFSHDDKIYVKDTWMEKVLEMINMQHFFNLGLTNMIMLEQQNNTKKLEIESIEKKLLKLYPNEVKVCRNVADNLEKILHDHRQFLSKRSSFLRQARLKQEKEIAKRKALAKRFETNL